MPNVAKADDQAPAFTIGPRPAWYLTGGITAGGTVGVDKQGGLVGGELSLFRLNDGFVIGGYGDAYYDFGIRKTYLTTGIQTGYKFVGFDAGPAFRLGDRGGDVGVTGRLFFTASIFSVYARYAYFDTLTDNHVVQVGAMLKLPLISPFGMD